MFSLWNFECNLCCLINKIIFGSDISPYSEVSIKFRFLDHLSISNWCGLLKSRVNDSIIDLCSLQWINLNRRLFYSLGAHTRPAYLGNISPLKINIFTSIISQLLRYCHTWVVLFIVRGNNLSLEYTLKFSYIYHFFRTKQPLFTFKINSETKSFEVIKSNNNMFYWWFNSNTALSL